MRLSEMQHKDIIDLNGNKIGNIIDVKIDENGIITAKKPTYGVLVPLIASLVDNSGNLLQYDIRKVIVRPK